MSKKPHVTDALLSVGRKLLEKERQMSNHTPGPWKAVDGGRFDPEVIITTEGRIDSHHGEICSMEIEFNGPHGVEQRANVHLIAAAPDLLEALLTLLGEHEDSDYMTAAEQRAKARAAIRKAKGEPA